MLQKCICIFLSILCWHANGQNLHDYRKYNDLTAQATVAHATGDYRKCIDFYKLAFLENYPFPDDIKQAAMVYLLMDNKDSAYLCLQQMVLHGWKLTEKLPLVFPNYPMIGTRENFLNIKDTMLENKLQTEYSILRDEYIKQVDYKLNKYLEYIMYHESFCEMLRRGEDLPEEEGQRLAEHAWIQQKQLFVNLLKSNNEFSRYKIDAWTSNFMEIAIIHIAQSVEKEEFEYFFDLLKQEVFKGNIHPALYATCYDACYAEWHDWKESYFGQQTAFGDDGQIHCLPVKDIKNVDVRRAEIGLPPLWAWCKLHHIELPMNYKP
jgi:hypothetical protein